MSPADSIRLSFADRRDSVIRFAPLGQIAAALDEAGLPAGPCLVVTDEHLAAHWLDALLEALDRGGWRPRVRVLPPGEGSKSLRTLSDLYDWALRPTDAPLPHRGTPLLALGGGVIGDLAGLAASTLLRGLPLVHIPTTLLAQIDSAIGGKTGINHAAGKNLIGTIYQPRLILVDPAVLATLPRREWFSGLAEAVKAAVVADRAFFEWLEAHWDAVTERAPGATLELVRRAAAIKARVVTADPHERGQRAILNFGHTFAHAIESATDYLVYTHGEAVALGMRAALHLSATLHPALDRARVEQLVRRIPTPPLEMPLETLQKSMRADKKRAAEGLRFVVLRELGRAEVLRDVPAGAVEAAWDHIRDGR